MENLIIALELRAEIDDLKALGLDEEEIFGFLDFFQDCWFDLNDLEYGN